MTRTALKRIAFCTPLNPVASGISDYSEELLPELARYFEITVIVDKGVAPANQELARYLAIEPINRLEKLHRRAPFDAIIYHMGNSPFHAAFYEMLRKLPGVLVLHDYVLHHLFLWRAVNVHKRIDSYLDEMSRRYGEPGLAVARQMLAGRNPVEAFEYPFVEEVVDQAQAVIAHSRYIADRVERLRPGLPVAVVPMGVPLPPPISQAEARARLGLAPQTLIWASFGHINPFKRLEPALRAFRRLREDHPDALYLLVGSVSPNYDITAVIRRLRLEQAVQVTGHVPAQQFQDYVAAADLCLNLRHPTAGETSASLLRLLGAGRPVLVSSSGAFSELPADVAAQVEPDECEEQLILAFGRRLASDAELAAELGRRARDHIAREHTLAQAAHGYARFLSQLHGWPEPKPAREALWDVNVEPGASPIAAAMEQRPEPRPEDALTSLVGQLIGSAAADLGVGEHDVVLLDRVAARLKGL